jgi:hypothetical protein
MTLFKPHTQEELKKLGVTEGKTCVIEYLDKDYFNGEETLERSRAVAIMNNGKISFIVSDPYGMDKFINNAKVIKD